MSRWTVFKPDVQRLEALGYKDIATCPALFNDRGYAHRQNRYLRDRATGRWVPKYRNGPSGASGETLSACSNDNNTYSLKDFLSWCDEARLDPDAASYSDVLDYQDDMASGAWSKKGQPLAAGTINPRGDEATFYLMWSADRGMRRPFDVTAIRAKRQPSGMRGSGQLVWVRPGRQKEDERSLDDLILPSSESVRIWLSVILGHRGYAKMLACRTVIETGLRKAEVCNLNYSDWPSAAKIAKAIQHRRPFVTMRVRRTKGSRPRVIMLSIRFAAMVREWLDKQRGALDLSFEKREGLSRSERLFVSDSKGHEGTPISGPTLYRCFKKKVPGGPETWFPHFGRHFFACTFILRGTSYDATLRGMTLASMGADWVHDRGNFWLKIVQRQLGHLSEQTTEIYLRWLVTSSQFAEIAAGYHSLLDSEVPPHGQ
jgi:integrase